MAKKKFASPFMILGGLVDEGDDTVIGGGSGQSGQESYLCDFDTWCIMFFGDYDEIPGDPDFHDYYYWFRYIKGGTLDDWTDCGNSAADWGDE